MDHRSTVRTLGLPWLLVLAACGPRPDEPETWESAEESTGTASDDAGPETASGHDPSTDEAEGTTGDRPEDETEGETESDPSTGEEPEPPRGCAAPRPVSIDSGCYPPVQPYAFHLIHQDFPDSWDAIADLAETQPELLITSQNRPPWLEPVRWAQRTSPSYHESGAAMADFVHQTFSDADTAPAVVLVDELRAEHVDAVAEFAAAMREQYPQWAGRWGVWLVHGIGVSYASLQPAIDELLLADAHLVAELYPAMSQYCSAASTTAGRDAWLAAYYRGGEGSFPQPRFKWMVGRRAELGSTSPLSLAFGVTETYLDRSQADVFLDRMFYVWRHKSGFGSLLFPGVGGVGAYKWHDHGPTTRDLDFVDSYLHYSVAQDPSSRRGPVPC